MDYRILPTTVNGLLSGLNKEDGYLSKNILIELHAKTLSILVNDLRNPDQEKRQQIIELLFKIDSNGDKIGPLLEPLLNSSDDILRSKITD